MSWLKVTGMIPPEAGNAWVSGNIVATALRSEDEGWADGTRRAVWPIEGVLSGAGTRWEARVGGDYSLPGANIGESAVPPSIELLAELTDQQGRVHRFRAVGKVATSALGEWSVNAPLSSIIIKGQNSGPNSWLETTVADVVAAAADARSATAASVIQMADTAQLQDALSADLGLTSAQNVAALTGKPAGGYRVLDGDRRVWWSGSAITAEAPAAASVSALEIQRGRTGARHNVMPANTAAQNTANLTLALAAMLAAGENTLHLGVGIYTGAIVQNIATLKITGEGAATWIGDSTGVGTELRGEIGKDAILTIQGVAGNVAATTVEGLGFRGNIANGILYGLKSTLGNGPGRPFVIRDSTFRGFTAAIRSDVPTGKSTGLFNVSSIGNVYQGNTYILLADGDGAVGNLTFINNVAEQNANGLKANLAVGAGGFFGTYNIADNLAEGQNNWLDLNCGLVAGVLGGNYYEATTGFIKLVSSRWQSAHTIMPQYVHNCPAMYGDIRGGYVWLYDHNLPWRLTNTQIRVMARPVLGVAPASAPAITGNVMVPSIPVNASAPAAYFLEPRTVGDLRDTPLGVLLMRSQTGTANPLINSRISVAPGFALCAATLVRAKTLVATSVGAAFFDSASALLKENPSMAIMPPGEWWVAHAVLSGVTTTTTPRIRWTSDNDIEIGPTTFYLAPVVDTTATAAQQAQNTVPYLISGPRHPRPRTGVPPLSCGG